MEAQGFRINRTVVFRDNLSTMKLEENGKAGSGKRTRHFDIKYFCMTVLIRKGEIQFEFCPSEDMIADYMTKSITGAKFHNKKNDLSRLDFVTGALNEQGLKFCQRLF
jgi:hypothetical protein